MISSFQEESVLRRPPSLLPREPSAAHLLTRGVSARSGCLQGDHTHPAGLHHTSVVIALD
ncbi:hypothetical protein E2C01_085104 [Portunus trituberculatus]|uniref:Uncharacterized protein n=1 Tax=Portunus trituberculatus TaxID=210409 RepID=A0A5B7JCN5_PORTR|nr:hypothetical protein [Portunus trituberculatus]